MSSSSLAATLLLVVAAISCHCHVARGRGGLGVNYGTVADDLPSAARSVELLRAAGAGSVKIYDANADILRALAGTGMPVSVMDGAPVWCVLAGGGGKAVNETAVAAAVEYACRQGSGTCAAIQAGGECNQPDSLDAHASYAFNAYWQQFRKAGGTCYFDGLAEKTTKDPSHGTCRFISSLD
uniref:X8 domain-containing protein n=1 Tax=Oryza brachyantha TaxID=4533 RepID=J3MUL3_ORYBR